MSNIQLNYHTITTMTALKSPNKTGNYNKYTLMLYKDKTNVGLSTEHFQ